MIVCIDRFFSVCSRPSQHFGRHEVCDGYGLRASVTRSSRPRVILETSAGDFKHFQTLVGKLTYDVNKSLICLLSFSAELSA
jgi:hypothetical protein